MLMEANDHGHWQVWCKFVGVALRTGCSSGNPCANGTEFPRRWTWQPLNCGKHLNLISAVPVQSRNAPSFVHSSSLQSLIWLLNHHPVPIRPHLEGLEDSQAKDTSVSVVARPRIQRGAFRHQSVHIRSSLSKVLFMTCKARTHNIWYLHIEMPRSMFADKNPRDHEVSVTVTHCGW